MADKTIEWLRRIRSQNSTTPWFAYVATGCSHAPHHVPREWSDKYKGVFDEGWDVLRGARSHARRAGCRSGRCRAHEARRGLRGVGLARRDPPAPVRAPDGGLRRLLRKRGLEHWPDPRGNRGAWRARQHARPLDLGRQRRQHGGHPQRHVQRDDHVERDCPDGRAADGAPLQARQPRGWETSSSRTIPATGRLRATPPSSGASRSPLISAARGTPWSCGTRSRFRTPAESAASSRT